MAKSSLGDSPLIPQSAHDAANKLDSLANIDVRIVVPNSAKQQTKPIITGSGAMLGLPLGIVVPTDATAGDVVAKFNLLLAQLRLTLGKLT